MSTLLKAVSDADTTLMISQESALPEDNGVVMIGNEQISYTSNYRGTLFGCTRGYNSTTPAVHALGSTVNLASYFAAPSGGTVSFPLTPGADALVNDASSIEIDIAGAPALTIHNDGSNNIISLLPAGNGILDIAGDGSGTLSVDGFGIRLGGANGTTISPLNPAAPVTIQASSGTDNSPALTLIPGNSAFAFDLYTNLNEMIFSDTAGTMLFKANNVSSLELDGSSTAHDTRMLLWDVDKNALSRVSVGANDSGGTGFKVLRVPN